MRLEGGGIKRAMPLQLGGVAPVKHDDAVKGGSSRSAARQLAARSAKENDDPLQDRRYQSQTKLPPDTWYAGHCSPGSLVTFCLTRGPAAENLH